MTSHFNKKYQMKMIHIRCVENLVNQKKIRKNQTRQESIPVGCVPTAKVASTPEGRYPGGGVVYTLPLRYPTPWIPYSDKNT